MGRLRSFTAVAAACVLTTTAAPAAAQSMIDVVNGAPELGEPTTAALVEGDAATGLAVCSAVLIGCDAAITTAHCFNSSSPPKNTLFFQHAGFVPIESATQHPVYVEAYAQQPPDFDLARPEDIAFLKLATPVSGVTPSTIVSGPPPAPGTPGWIVGFGRDPVTQATSFDPNAGIKRSGSMQLTACTDTLAGFDVLCWYPDLVLGDPGQNVSTCNGDSGGPLFVDEGGTRVVAGITKGAAYVPQGQPDLCLPPVQPYDTNVERHRSWIQAMVLSTGAMDLATKSCGPLAQLPEDAASGLCDGAPWTPGEPPRACGFQGDLGGGFPTQVQHVFDVPPGTELLRVALNGFADAAVDTDFYVRAGAAPTPLLYDCAAAASGNLGFCEFPAPAPGSWFVLLDQVAGVGEYQVTVTLLPEPSASLGLLIGSLFAGCLRRRAAARKP